MMIELKREDLPAFSQYAIKVFYENEIEGEYFADILVDDKEVGLLLNFGPKSEVKRKVFDNFRK